MKNSVQKQLAGAIIAFSFGISSSVFGQDTATTLSAAPLFASHTPIEVTIEAPLTTLMKERPDEEYLEGTFRLLNEDGTEQSFDLKIRARGNFRRLDATCDFTPIRLNFRKKQVKDTLFDGQDKLKLVTHCKSGVPYFEQLVLREYLAYRFLQVITDKSFSVRLLRINYIDSEGGESITKAGFVIEDNDDVAKRFGMQTVETGDITHDDIDPQYENRISVFQYMIGNTDYSMINGVPDKGCCHNSELMSATGEAPYIAVPYDFDFAGLVNAPYATVAPQFRLRSVRHRRYRGRCANNEYLPETIQHFMDNKDALYAIIDEVTWLESRSRNDATSFVDTFFKTISTPKKIASQFLGKCNDV